MFIHFLESFIPESNPKTTFFSTILSKNLFLGRIITKIIAQTKACAVEMKGNRPMENKINYYYGKTGMMAEGEENLA